MNLWSGIGRLVKDPELKYTSTGNAIATFTIAVNRSFKNAEGKYEADFIRCQIWRKPAEVFATYTQKGSQVGITGRIQTGSYTDKDGGKVFTTEIVVDSCDFLDKKSDATPKPKTQPDDGFYARDAFNNHPDPFQHGESIDISDDSLPF